MATLMDIQNKINNRVLILRSIQRLIHTKVFEDIYERSDLIDRIEVEDYIEKYKKESIIRWMRNHPKLELGERSHQTLKEIAKELRIKNWSRMNKIQLVKAIGEHNEKTGNA